MVGKRGEGYAANGDWRMRWAISDSSRKEFVASLESADMARKVARLLNEHEAERKAKRAG
jgi:hypothetical protein